MIIFNDEKIISEQTKEILENFFCFNGVESRKKFQKLIINKEKYNQRLWSEDETIVNHLLSHSQFKFTKTKCDELIKISEDWSSPNINGENAAFFLIKSEMKIIDINEIIQKININIYQKNLNNFYFINYFLKTETFEKIVEDSLKGKNNFPEIRVAKELKKYHFSTESTQYLLFETHCKTPFSHIKPLKIHKKCF